MRYLKVFAVKLLSRLRPLMSEALGHRIELMIQQQIHPLEPELTALPAVLKALEINCELAVDIGANHGLWAVELGRYFNRVIAVEPNPYVAAALRTVVPKNCAVIECGVSSSQGKLLLHVPSVRGRVLSGWASFETGNCPDADKIVDVEVPVTTLDEILGSATPAFIKIDVEGHEFEAISGAKDVLTRARPLLMIEVKKHDELRLAELLLTLGYLPRKLSQLCGIAGTSENTFFVPTELAPLVPTVQRR